MCSKIAHTQRHFTQQVIIATTCNVSGLYTFCVKANLFRTMHTNFMHDTLCTHLFTYTFYCVFCAHFSRCQHFPQMPRALNDHGYSYPQLVKHRFVPGSWRGVWTLPAMCERPILRRVLRRPLRQTRRHLQDLEYVSSVHRGHIQGSTVNGDERKSFMEDI